MFQNGEMWLQTAVELLWYSLRNTTTTPHTVKKTSRNTSEKAVLKWKQPGMFFVEETAISVFVFFHILITSTVYVESFLNDRDLRDFSTSMNERILATKCKKKEFC